MTDTPPLAGQVVVFAGTLSRMSRREATALVERQLGRVATAVTRETTMLVVDATAPEQGTPDERRVAEAMKLNARYPGRVRLLTEDEFYDLVMAAIRAPRRSTPRARSAGCIRRCGTITSDIWNGGA
jgi:DNA polymerase-3 subunit epsilon